MSKWNGKSFSVYESEEKSALGLIKELGQQTNYNTDELEQVKISDNKKVSYDDLHTKYQLTTDGTTADFTGSWFGIKRPTQSDVGLAATVENILNKKLLNNGDKKCVVSFIFDDARQSVYELGLDIFKRNNLTASIALIVKNLETQSGNVMTPNNILDMYNSGWDFLCHGYNSAILNESALIDTAKRELIESKQICNKYGIKLNGYVPSNGVIAEKYIDIVRKNYKYAFCNYASGYLDYNKSVFELNRYSIENKDLTTVKQMIDKAKENETYLVFYLHDVLESGDYCNTTSNIQAIIDYCISKDIAIMNVADAMDYYFNIKSDNNIIVESEIKYPIINSTDKSLLWSYTTSGATNCTLTPFSNLQTFLKLSWNDAPWSSNYPIWKDLTIDTTINSIYGCVEIPVICNYTRIKIELRIELFKDSTSLGIINTGIINNTFTKKDLLKAHFFIAKNTDCNKLRIRIQPVNDLTGNTAELYIYTPILKIFSN